MPALDWSLATMASRTKFLTMVQARGRQMKQGKRLIASVASGLLAAALSLWYGASLQAGAEQERQEMLAAYGGDLVSVCVASRDIDAGETIDEGCVRVEEWVAGMLPSGALTSVDDVIGRQATSAIPEQAVLCPLYFETRSGSLDIPEGRVAVRGRFYRAGHERRRLCFRKRRGRSVMRGTCNRYQRTRGGSGERRFELGDAGH